MQLFWSYDISNTHTLMHSRVKPNFPYGILCFFTNWKHISLVGIVGSCGIYWYMTSWHILPCSLFICSIVYREVWILVWSSLNLNWLILQSHNLSFLFHFYTIWHRLKCQLKLKTAMGTFERVWLFNGVLRLLLWHTIKLPLFGRIVFLDASYWCLIQPYSHCYRRPSLLSRKEHTCWSMDVEGSRNFVPSGFPMWVY